MAPVSAARLISLSAPGRGPKKEMLATEAVAPANKAVIAPSVTAPMTAPRPLLLTRLSRLEICDHAIGVTGAFPPQSGSTSKLVSESASSAVTRPVNRPNSPAIRTVVDTLTCRRAHSSDRQDGNSETSDAASDHPVIARGIGMLTSPREMPGAAISIEATRNRNCHRIHMLTEFIPLTPFGEPDRLLDPRDRGAQRRGGEQEQTVRSGSSSDPAACRHTHFIACPTFKR